MRDPKNNKSLAKDLQGTVKEILGTAFSVGCQVDGKSPKEVSDAISNGEIESMSLVDSHICEHELILLQFRSHEPSYISQQQPLFPQVACSVVKKSYSAFFRRIFRLLPILPIDKRQNFISLSAPTPHIIPPITLPTLWPLPPFP